MSIGTALFSSLSIARFARTDSELAALQGRIAEGTNDPRASANPAQAAQLSAAREQQGRLAAYQANADAAGNRLALTDTTLGAMADVMRQVKDLALEAANTATASGSAAIHANQLQELRSALLGLANSRDAAGFPLFSGYAGTTPFVDGAGGVHYAGDTGEIRVQVSESLRLPTGISGDAALMAIDTDQGTRGVFDLIDDLAASLTTLAGSVASASLDSNARLDLATSTKPTPLSLTLTGPAGSAEVTVLPQTGAPGPVVAAINAVSAMTGISASIDSETGALRLDAAGRITVSGLASAQDAAPLATFGPPDGTGTPLRLHAARLSGDAIIGQLGAALDHLAEARGQVGAVAAEMTSQSTRLSQRRLTVDQAVAGLNDLDLAAASTRLAALMTQQQAGMQTYSMITRKTLFDFLG